MAESESPTLAKAAALLQEGHADEAAEVFSALISSGVQSPDAYRGRGIAYMRLERWKDAVSDLTAARRLDPDDPEIWVNLAVSLARDNEIYPALAAFESVLIAHPNHLRAHVELAMVHFRLGAFPKGQQELRLALGCRPTLEQRRAIEQMLAEQKQLDHKRHFRPDFEALHRAEQARASDSWLAAAGRAVAGWFKKGKG